MTIGRERGTIASWTDRHGEGRVKADNGDVLYARFSALLIDHSPRPGAGLRVEFSRVRGPGSYRQFAVAVNVLDSKGQPSIQISDDPQ